MDILGIDVAKAFLAVWLLLSDQRHFSAEFANSPAGLEKLQAWLKKHQVKQLHVCMEATNIYWEQAAEFLHQQGYQVSVVNPARIKGFALSQLRRTKTDKLDSQVIAQFCAAMTPTLWRPPNPSQKQLRALVRHRKALQKSLTQQTNRLAACTEPMVQGSLQRLIHNLKAEIAQIEHQAQQTIEADPDLKKKQSLLVSIQGLGLTTATELMAEMYDLADYTGAPAAAADAGLTPCEHTSGSSVKRQPKLSKVGKASVRSALYWPAITAIRFNPIVRALAERLRRRGKLKKVIIAAAMRKLLHLAYGVLKHQQPFDPHYLDKLHPST